MSERVELLLDALDTGRDEFERVWNELQATPEDLEGEPLDDRAIICRRLEDIKSL